MARRGVVLALVLVAAAAIWSGAWVYAAGEAGRRLDAWRKAEADLGRDWTCPERRIGGYPFALTIDCTGATFVGHGRDHTDTATLAHVAAAVTLLHPRHVALSLRAPFSFRTSDRATDVAATWAGLDVDLAPASNIRTVDLRGTDIAVNGTFGPSGRQDGGAARLSARLTMLYAEPRLAFTVAIGGTDIPPLDALFGDTRQVDIDLAGQLDQARLGEARTLNAIVDTWRQAGGRVDLASAHLQRGRSALSAHGSLSLDEDHRPRGLLQAQFVGLGPILEQYGINPGLAAAGSLLSTLFGGGGRQAAPPGAISLPIDLRDGRLGIGPVATSIALPALY